MRIPFTRRTVVKPKKIRKVRLDFTPRKEELFNARPQWPRGPERVEESDIGTSSWLGRNLLVWYLIICGIGLNGFLLVLSIIYFIK